MGEMSTEKGFFGRMKNILFRIILLSTSLLVLSSCSGKVNKPAGPMVLPTPLSGPIAWQHFDTKDDPQQWYKFADLQSLPRDFWERGF